MDARPGNGARGLKLLGGGQTSKAFRDARPGNGARGLKHDRQFYSRVGAHDARPGNGARGLKLTFRRIRGRLEKMRAPATGRED